MTCILISIVLSLVTWLIRAIVDQDHDDESNARTDMASCVEPPGIGETDIQNHDCED